MKTTIETSVSISIAPEKDVKRSSVVDVRIKWIVTTYIFGSFGICIGNVCEQLVYALVENIEKICVGGIYVVYLRVIVEGLFFSFYLVRTMILLQGSVFEISKCKQYWLGIAPAATFGTALFAYNIYSQLSDCDEAGVIVNMLLVLPIFVHLFWNVTLFSFLAYHVYKVEKIKN
ncbi:hypothetical protein RFI_35390, partial [Reticulomyxa filosa]